MAWFWQDEQAVKLLLELCGGKVDDSQAPSTICVSEAELGEPSGSQATTSVPRILVGPLPLKPEEAGVRVQCRPRLHA